MQTSKKHRKRRTLKRVRYGGASNNLQVKYPPKEINNYITNVIYINLDKRTDRNESMLKQLEVFDKSKITRISAINNPEAPVIGCATSHLNAIKMAREKKFPNVLILEDDAVWENVKKGYDSFKKLVEQPYDVIMLGGTYKSYNIKTSRISSAQSAASYLINSSYYDKIITRIENTLNDPATDKYVDVIYTHMQKQDNWLLVVPALMIQAPSVSNIEKRKVNYTNLFYNPTFNPENTPNSNQSGGNNETHCIFAKLNGGLGNYLFIYAAALLVKNKIKQENNIDLPICFTKNVNPHSNIDYINELLKQGSLYTNPDLDQRLANATILFSNLKTPYNDFSNTNIKYDNKDIRLKDTHYQNYEGIKSVIPIIRDHIIPILKNKYSDEKYKFKDICDESAFMHIRRGDYKIYNSFLPLTYYQSALDLLVENKNIKKLYIVSDDISWCRKQQWNIHSLKSIFVDNPDELYCLYIMSQCLAGAIISNSTFSLWGVFLGSYNNKTAKIIYPSEWFSKTNSNNLRLPKEWMRLEVNSNQSGGDISKYTIYVFWTGTNEMSSDRKNCLEDLKKVSKCNVILVTPDNLKDYIKPEVPLHEAYQYLSETHKADYLRTYFMNYIGGGYSDIKKTTGSWKKSFDDLAISDKWICGYKEVGPGGVAYAPHADKWKELIGNGAYICKPNTPLTNEWYNSMVDLIDTKLEELKKNPAKGPQNVLGSGSGYPLEWNEMLGRIFHRVIYNYKDKIMNTLPISIFSNYR